MFGSYKLPIKYVEVVNFAESGAENIEANKRAKKMGHETATLFYELRLEFAKVQADFPEEAKKRINKPRIRRENI